MRTSRTSDGEVRAAMEHATWRGSGGHSESAELLLLSMSDPHFPGDTAAADLLSQEKPGGGLPKPQKTKPPLSAAEIARKKQISIEMRRKRNREAMQRARQRDKVRRLSARL